jgi:hypothetical protein
MNTKLLHSIPLAALIVTFALCLSAGSAGASDLKLSGANEVPPVTTAASGTGTISVADDGSVSGSVKVMGSPPRWRTSTWGPPVRMGL